MSEYRPVNDLDRAIMAVYRSRSAMPEFYRRLREGELSFFIPYHPEVEGEDMELRNGMTMPFILVEDSHGPVVPLFSSVARAEEAMERFQLPPRTYSLGTMDAKLVLGILGKGEMRAVVNKGCATGELTIPADLMRDVASGKVFEPMDLDSDEPDQRQTLKVLDPADYPTDLIQPLFETLRRYANFRATWVLGFPDEDALPVERRRYQLLVLMEPRDEVVFHEFAMVLGAVRTHIPNVESGLLDETDRTYIAQVFASAEPFFTAVDYTRPRVARG